MSQVYPQGSNRAQLLRAARASRSALASDRATKIVGALVAITVCLCPFDAILSIGFLGESSHEIYTILSLAFAPIVLFLLLSTGTLIVRRELVIILSLIILTIIISLIPNITSIVDASVKGRSGLEKYITSAVVPIFGMYVAILINIAVSRSFRRYFLTPVIIGACIVFAVGSLELLSFYIGALKDLSDRVYFVTHAGLDRLEALTSRIGTPGAPLRVSSVLFEPADFGTYVIYVFPWLIASWLSPLKRGRDALQTFIRTSFYLGLIVIGLVLCAFSGRTAALGAPVIVLLYFVLCICMRLAHKSIYFRPLSYLIASGAAFLYLAPLALLLAFSEIAIRAALESDSISNVSRLGTVMIQLDLFWDNPIFGVGMGQYAFYVAQYLPAWADTYEFKRWMSDSTASFFPTFATFARLAGEMGLIGLITWVGFLVYLLHKTTMNVRVMYISKGRLPHFGIAIMAGFFSIGLTAIGLASYRTFWLWALLGIAACYVSTPSAIEDGGLGNSVTPLPTGQRQSR
jgi:hypothetical protein